MQCCVKTNIAWIVREYITRNHVNFVAHDWHILHQRTLRNNAQMSWVYMIYNVVYRWIYYILYIYTLRATIHTLQHLTSIQDINDSVQICMDVICIFDIQPCGIIYENARHYVYVLYTSMNTWHHMKCIRGLASTSRLLKIISFFCKRAPYKRRYSAKETCNFKEPTNRSHPICLSDHRRDIKPAPTMY